MSGLSARARTRRAYVQMSVSLLLAGWLLFWFFEALGPRMEIVKAWSIEHQVLVFTQPGGAYVSPGTLFSPTGGLP